MRAPRPALLASVGLHVAVVAAGLFVLPSTRRETPPGAPVTVTLLSEAPSAPAIPAPEPTPPQTPAPELDAPAETLGEVEGPPEPAPAPPPEPTPPQPTPPQPTPPRPTPPRPQPRAEAPAPRPQPRRPERPAPPRRETPPPRRQEPTLDLDALAQLDRPQRRAQRPQQQARLDLDRLSESLQPARRSAGAQRSSAQQGPARPRAAPTGPSGASGRSEETALALSAISERLQRTWNPNCAAPGGDQLRVRVTISLNRDGSLQGAPRPDGAADGDTVRGVAIQRAVAAIRAAEPFDTLPPERYAEWDGPITINFNAREACRR